jgi:hypothetical protein
MRRFSQPARARPTELLSRSDANERRTRALFPAARGRRSPQLTHSDLRAGERSDAAMTITALHASRIVRPLDRIHDRIETRIHDIAQMTTPTLFGSHDRSDASLIHSHNADRRQAVPDAFVQKRSARMCCCLATRSAGSAFIYRLWKGSLRQTLKEDARDQRRPSNGSYMARNFSALMQ